MAVSVYILQCPESAGGSSHGSRGCWELSGLWVGGPVFTQWPRRGNRREKRGSGDATKPGTIEILILYSNII